MSPDPTLDGPAVVLDGVSVTYSDAPAPILREVQVRIEEGELALVVGRTGSGKSTLLGAISGAVPHFTGGRLAGRVLVGGRDTRTHRPRDLSDVVGVVGQDPLAGFVTDTVEEELAYAMEELGLPDAVMRKRVEETLDVMGIAELRGAALRELSGGQQQRVAIGSVLTAHPRIIVLDEPTSALDPTGAEEVLATITRLVHDLAVTVIVAEHRIERVLQYADTLIHVGRDGRVTQGRPEVLMETSDVAPPVVELGRWAGWSPLPLSIRQARRRGIDLRLALRHSLERVDAGPAPTRSPTGPAPTCSPAEPLTPPSAPAQTEVRVAGVVIRHGEVIAVAGVDLTLRGGSVTALMGRNGAGKSSLLWALQGALTPTRGSVRIHSAGSEHEMSDLRAAKRRALAALVPQTPSDLLYLDTVTGECHRADTDAHKSSGTCADLLAQLAPGIDPATHPRDLSEGQKLALVLSVQLTADPPVVLLDEPTRGLDYAGKAALRGILRALSAAGRVVVVSTHDVEFVAQCADRVVVLAAGEVVADGPTAEVVIASPAFAPQISKITGPGPWLTLADVRAAVPEPPR